MNGNGSHYSENSGEKRYSQGGEGKVKAVAEAVNSVGPAEVLWHVEFCLEGEPIERSCACQEPSTPTAVPLSLLTAFAVTRTVLAPTVRC